MNEAVVQHLVGFFGLIVAYVLSWSPLKAVLRSREAGSLGGLDTRNWSLFFFCNLMWTLYGVQVGDIWLFMSTAIPMIIWLWFCITAVELLSQEEGELFSPRHGKVFDDEQQDSLFKAWVDFETVHDWSATYRKKAIKNLERRLALFAFVGVMMAFLCGQRSIVGLEFVDDFVPLSVRSKMLSSCAGLSGLACWVVPVLRIGSLIQRRDASSIFVPLTLGQLLCTASWFSYGVLSAEFSLMLPNGVGVLCAVAQLLVRLAFGPGDAAVGPEEDLESEPRSPTSPVPLKRWPSAPFSEVGSTLGSHGAAGSPELEATTIPSSMASTPRPTWGGPPGPDLPDLSQRLKDCGVYEDYLKWQRGYRRWRQGGGRGAQGEIDNLSPMQPAPTSPGMVVQEAEEKEEPAAQPGARRPGAVGALALQAEELA